MSTEKVVVLKSQEEIVIVRGGRNSRLVRGMRPRTPRREAALEREWFVLRAL
jgi:hypothetical protein